MPQLHLPMFPTGVRMITSQFCASGYTKQSDIIRAFGVTSISVKRSVKRSEEHTSELQSP